MWRIAYRIKRHLALTLGFRFLERRFGHAKRGHYRIKGYWTDQSYGLLYGYDVFCTLEHKDGDEILEYTEWDSKKEAMEDFDRMVVKYDLLDLCGS